MGSQEPSSILSIIDQWGLYTDFYELTMSQGYFIHGLYEKPASFDYYFRKMPCSSGYVVFAGLADLLDAISNFTFSEAALQRLKNEGFRDDFIQYLKTFKFQGDIYAPQEGEIVFSNEPIIIVKGNVLECQIIETLLLNIINFQSLIATRASRIENVTGPERLFADFGFRRAHGMGAIQASRAAIIGGATSTSNVMAAEMYDLKVMGTMAHAWIQVFDDELLAFKKYAQVYPDNCVLLVDTYNTLKSGVPNAILVARELEEKGHRLRAIRIDSGDMAYLSKQARYMLDNAGMPYVKIFSSNQLDELLIRSLNLQHAPIDGFGVGTRLVTSYDCPALGGVYKLSSFDRKPRMKLSDDIVKISLPGGKWVWRFLDKEGTFYRDGILLDDQSPESISRLFHPTYKNMNTKVAGLSYQKLQTQVMNAGVITSIERNPYRISDYRKKRLSMLSNETKRFENPHIYKVGLSKKLWNLRSDLMKVHQKTLK